MKGLRALIRFLQENVTLLKGAAPETLQKLLDAEGSRRLEYEKGALLCRSGAPLDGLLVLLSGRAEVRKGSLLLRDLSAGDVTGVSVLFGGDSHMETDVAASGRMSVLFLPREAVEKAILADPVLTERYIRFLSSRIRFLNGVIGRFSGSRVTERTAHYLLEQAGEKGLRFEFAPSRAARELDVGRASVYRALDDLQREGCIEKEGRQILLKDPDRLRSMLV